MPVSATCETEPQTVGQTTDSKDTNDRFSRQSDLVPAARLKALNTVAVIGVGAIGRQAALQLGAIGAPNITLVDFDKVDLSNITTQGYPQDSIGFAKVDVTEADIKRLDAEITVTALNDRWRPTMSMFDAIFCCVDSISIRQKIFDWAWGETKFWVDGRMLGENIRILAVTSDPDAERYRKTFFAENEAAEGRCTARSTIYSASIAAGMMVHQFTRWLRGIPTEADTLFPMLSGELIHDMD